MRLSILIALFAGTPALADSREYGHMMDYGYGIGMIFGPLLWLVILGGIVAGAIWLVRRTDGQGPSGNGTTARAELDMRFAKGEIDAEEYAARKKMLSE